ncbi:PX domain-containing protein [Cladophialophora immunda]|nr:PX domain-containing protein [Cladophialophora immunda]
METSRSVPITALGSDQPKRDSVAAPVVDGAERSGDRPRPSPTPPPYWQPSREPSFDELSATRPPPIALEDHTLSREPSRAALWAKSISIDEYVIVQGNPTGVGAYVVYNINVQTLDGGPMTIRKRYSEFDELRAKLVKAYPQSTRSSLPPLPPKSAIYKFRPKFLEKRREGLAYFLNCVMLNPEYAGSTFVKDFIFPPET